MCHNGIVCASPSRNEKHADRRTNHSAAGRLVTRLARTLPVNCAVCPPGQSVSSDCPDSRGHIGIPTGCWVSDARARPAPRDQLVRPRRSTRARSIVDGHGKTWSILSGQWGGGNTTQLVSYFLGVHVCVSIDCRHYSFAVGFRGARAIHGLLDSRPALLAVSSRPRPRRLRATLVCVHPERLLARLL